VRWVGVVDSSQYQEKCTRTATEQHFWLTILRQMSEFPSKTLNAAMSHLPDRSCRLKKLSHSFKIRIRMTECFEILWSDIWQWQIREFLKM
jgi:hypothetical protein